MATIRRAGFGTVFELEDSKVGIGTDAATHTLQALGNIRSEAATDIGISSLSTYQGFTDKEARFTTGQINNQSQSGATSGEIVIDGDVTVSSATTFTSGPQHLTVTDTFTLPSGDTDSREIKPTVGSLRFNQEFATLEFYTGNNWATVNTLTEMQNSSGNRGRGLLGGGASGPSGSGNTPTNVSAIRHVNIASQGNAVLGGDLLNTATRVESCGSSTRAIWGGGYTPSNINVIQYRAFASDGNSIDFGDMSQGRNSHFASSSSTRALFGGGYGTTNSIDYIQINTIGNSLDFGDLSFAKHQNNSAQSPTRCVLGGGTPGNGDGEIQFLKFASKGNSIKFGDLNFGRRDYGGGGNSVRGLYCGGAPGPTTTMIEYITIASEGNGNVFGDLTVSSRSVNCIDSQTRTLIIGRSGPLNTIDFVTIATAGNAVDFGDDIFAILNVAGSSDSHGGLGGF